MVLAQIVALGAACDGPGCRGFALGIGTVAFRHAGLALAGRALPRRSRGIERAPCGSELTRFRTERRLADAGDAALGGPYEEETRCGTRCRNAFPTAGASTAVAVRSTDPTSSTVAVPSFGNCRQLHNRW